MLKNLLREIQDNGISCIDTASMIFTELCDYFQEGYLQEADYVDGRKVSGLEASSQFLTTLKALRDNFGKRAIRNIPYAIWKTTKAALENAKPTRRAVYWRGEQGTVETEKDVWNSPARRLAHQEPISGW